MEFQNEVAYEFAQQPPSPGFSDLLASLVADDTDDTSCTKPDATAPRAQPQPDLDPMDVFPASTNPCGGTAPSTGLTQTIAQPQSIFDAFTQRLGPLSADLQLALLLGQTWDPSKVSALTAAGPRLEPVAAGQQPTFAAGLQEERRVSCGSGAVAVGGAGSRRGRRPLPRLTDLQQHLDCLTQQFQLLSQENSFLRGKLKLLERVLPYRASHIGFLAAVKNGQPAPGTGPYIYNNSPAPADDAAAPLQPSAAAVAAHAAAATAAAATTAAATAVSSGSSFSSGSSCPASTGRPLEMPGATAASGAAAVAEAAVIRPSAATATAAPMAAAGVAATATGGGGSGGGGGENAGWGCGPHVSAGAQGGSVRPTGHEGCGAAVPAAAAAAATTPTTMAAPPTGSWSTAPPAHLPGTPTLLALCPGPDGEVPPVTPAALEEFKRVTPRDFQRLYKHMVLQMSVLCTSAEVHGPASPQHARLERFLDRVFVYMDQVMLLSPDVWIKSMYVNVETGQPERPPEEFWHALGRGLQLTPEQIEEYRMCRAIHTANVAPVAQERLKLATELSATLSAAVSQPPRSDGDAIKTLSEVDEVTERLRRNVIKEHQVQMDIADFLCMGVLTPIQVARCMAGSYPYLPDGVAMLHACDPMGGAAASGAEMTHGSQR